jgi:hypothetical protein
MAPMRTLYVGMKQHFEQVFKIVVSAYSFENIKLQNISN